jgi:hypothetical protein
VGYELLHACGMDKQAIRRAAAGDSARGDSGAFPPGLERDVSLEWALTIAGVLDASMALRRGDSKMADEEDGWAQRDEEDRQLERKLREAIGWFLAEFATFEAGRLPLVIASLSEDPRLVDLMSDLMDLSGKIILVERLSKVRGFRSKLMRRIDEMLKEARKLSEERNEVAHGRVVIDSSSVEQNSRAGRFAAIARSRGKRGQMPEKFKSRAEKEAWLRGATHAPEEIETYARRAMQLNHTARGVAELIDLVVHEGFPEEELVLDE